MNTAHYVRRATLTILACGCALSIGVAQVAPEITGVIKNDAGGDVVGASITVTSARGVRSVVKSDEQGRYVVTVAAPGSATVTVEAAGFATTTRSITVPPMGAVTLDFKLPVAATESVVVGRSLTSVSIESSQNLSTITLTGRSLDALPNDPESLLTTLRMFAGTTGTRADQVAIYVDGMPLDRRLPPKDIIQSIRINANPFSAEFAEPGPSRIEITTKPASEGFHGEGRFDFNDAIMNARNLFEPERAPMQIRGYVGYLGGPIVKDRWGVLLYGGRWEQDENIVVNATTIDPKSLLANAFRQNVLTPTRTFSYAVKTDAVLARQHMLAIEYAQENQRQRNAGLQSGFDLPERAFGTTSKEQSVNLLATSTFADRVLNEFRARASRSHLLREALSTAPAIVVLESFSGGGSQEEQFKDFDTDKLTLTNVTTVAGAAHSVRFGVQAEVDRLTQIDRANFNGAYIFGSDVVRDAGGNPILGPTGEPTAISALDLYRLTLAATPGYRPSQFYIVRGDPSADFRVPEAAAFAQDDWRLSPRITVSYGVRAEYQERLGRQYSFAPRGGVAWAPSADGRSALRVGFGLFYTRIPQTLYSDVLRLDGRHSEQFVVNLPAFYPLVPETLPGAQVLTSIRTQSPDMTAPSSVVSTISYDRQLTSRLFGSVGYTWRRGIDLLRTRVLTESNGNGQSTGNPILQFESTGRSSAHEIHATANGNLGSRVSMFGGYAWAFAKQDTDTAYTAPANSSDLAAEWGRALTPRHQLSFGATIDLPWQLQVNPLIKAASALPFNITTGRDNNGDTLFTDRPAFAQAGDVGAIVTPYGVFNPNPLPGEALVPRNFGQGPTEVTFDLTFARTFTLAPGRGGSAPSRFTLFLVANNLVNRTNLAPFNGVLTSPFFGTANRALNPRRLTLSGRYTF